MHRLLAIAIVLISVVHVDASPFVRANVYFLPWLVESFVAMPPEELRRAAQHRELGGRVFHVSAAARVAEIVRTIDPAALRPTQGDYREDTRLVVDLFDSAGRQTSYRAAFSYVANLNNTMRRPVDERFRKYFETFTP